MHRLSRFRTVLTPSSFASSDPIRPSPPIRVGAIRISAVANAREPYRWTKMGIEVVDPDPAWPSVFLRLRDHVAGAVGELAIAIEHVGSTSVPGLAAKPVIDMSIVVASKHLTAALDRLATLGYRHRGDLGVEGREAFDNPEGLPAHHLYLCPVGSLGLRNQLAVRDHLRSYPEVAAAYGDLKKRLATRFSADIDAYIDGKTDFILGILAQTDLAPEELARIEQANRSPRGRSRLP